MDLVWDATDINGVPLLPHWRSQERDGRAASTKPCDDFPEREQDGRLVVSYGDPPCTSQQAMIRPDRPHAFVNHNICYSMFGGERGRIHGHLNWTIVADSGRISFQDHSKGFWVFTDDDYTFLLGMTQLNGLTEGNHGQLGIEFKAEETVDHLGSKWWRTFRHTVDHDERTARALINQRRARVTGLLGLDGQHDFHTELHPVWTLAIEAESSVQHDVWALLVRNWGNEGFCSANQHYVDFDERHVSLLLPWAPGADSVAVLAAESELFTNRAAAVSGPGLAYVVDQGLAVSFDLPVPEQTPLVDGVLVLRWFSGGEPLKVPPRSEAATPLAGPAPPAQGRVDPESRLAALAGRLTPAQRTLLEAEEQAYGALAFRPRIPDSRSALSIGEARKHGAFLPAEHVPAVRDTFDVARDAIERRRLQILCKVFEDSIPLAELGRCRAP